MNPTEMSVLAALSAAKVDYVVVGGVAVIAHGYVRMTRDLDIFIRPSFENAKVAFDALSALNVVPPGIDSTDLLCDEEHLRFPAEAQYVDILSSIGDMHFQQVWSGRVEVTIEGQVVPFISKADLIENKLATGRNRDLIDVEELEHIHSKIEDE